MCFRPPSVGKAIKCPACGAPNPGIAKSCVKCKEDLTAAKEEVKQSQTK
jgi:ribosomal protein L40E